MGMPRDRVGSPNRAFPGYYWAHHGRGMRGHLHSLEKHRGRKKPKLRAQRKSDPAQSPLRPVPAEPQPMSRSEAVTMHSWGTALQLTFWTNSVGSWRCGTHWRMQGKSFCRLCNALYQQLEWGSNSEGWYVQVWQLRSLGSRGGYWADWVSELSWWGDPPWIHRYISISEPLPCLARSRSRMR